MQAAKPRLNRMKTALRIIEAEELLENGLPLDALALLGDLTDSGPMKCKALELAASAYLLLKDPTKAALFRPRSVVTHRTTHLKNSHGFGVNDEEYSGVNDSSEAEYIPGDEYLDEETSRSVGVEPGDNEAEVWSTEISEAHLEDIWQEFEEPIEIGSTDSWEHVLSEDGFFDLQDEQFDYEAIPYNGSISQEERARQIVSEMAIEYELSIELFDVLTNIVAFYKCHGQTRLAMRRLLEGGVSADELEILFELRQYWVGYEGFSRAYYNGVEPTAAYLNLSWPLGLDLLRYLRCNDVETALGFIEDCFDDWQFSSQLLQGFSSFRVYLEHLMNHARWCQPDPPPAFVDYQLFERSEDTFEDLPGSVVYQWLEEQGLLYDK